MTRWFVSLCLQRVVLPIALVAGIALRQNGLSGIYLFLLLLTPLIPIPNARTMAGCTGHFQKAVIVLAALNIFAAVIFQIVIAFVFPPYGHLVEETCGWLERIFRYAGFIRANNLPVVDYFLYIGPEIIVLITGIIVNRICSKLNPRSSLNNDLLPLAGSRHSGHNITDSVATQRKMAVVTILGKYVVLMSMCMAGILRPSLLSAVYYLSFLGLITAWACNRQLGRAFAWYCRFLMIVLAVHLIGLFTFQMQWAQEVLPPDSPIPRYLGLTALIATNCTSDPRDYTVIPSEWASFANPFVLVWLYFILCFLADAIINAPDSPTGSGTPDRNAALTESTPLIRGKETPYKRTPPRRGLVQDSRGGSITVTETTEEIKMEDSPEDTAMTNEVQGERIPLEDLKRKSRLATSITEMNSGVLEIVVNVGLTIAQLLAQSSYIGTNIIMMAWSITYHSWLTFVLLLWASVMWLVPNQRRAMLKSSPFLVFYALFLLLSQYAYGMDLTDEELPETVQGVNLKQIGFEKVRYLPVKPLAIKTCFTIMFWITLKQYIIEKQEARNQSALADIAAPLQIGVGTATAMGDESQTKTNQLISKFGANCRSLLTKFWIWVVASILFTIGISGERMTIFRIIYMALALVFILTFQISWSIWRRIMYGFWLTVIIYSMLILVMTYTYQFDNFDDYWERYLFINKKLQRDIGLERFDTANLFVKLLTPTFFVIITVIQLYYFHKDFLAISDIKSRGTSSVRPKKIPFERADTSSKSEFESDMEDNTLVGDAKPDKKKLTQLKQALKNLTLTSALHFLGKSFHVISELVWLFLELHILKVVMFVIMMVGIYNVCALHLLFVFMAVISLLFGTNIQIVVSHAMSFFASLVLLAKMIYQIEYIDHSQWNVNCTEKNLTYNSAEWVGFNKTDSQKTLSQLLSGYIAIIMIVTFHAVVMTRQKYHRHIKGRSLARPLVMFPRVTYIEMDKDVQNMVKYLANYLFYRFGVEICLIGMVVLIGTRMDVYAMAYAIWICVLITPRRVVLSTVWPILVIFIVVTIPFQYALCVGAPPFMCLDYPWNEISFLLVVRTWFFYLPHLVFPPWGIFLNLYPWEDVEALRRLKEWMFLPDEIHPPPSYKLVCDFLLLLLVCRQGVVFRIERRHIVTGSYPGGSNQSIIHEAEKEVFRNPTPDYISYTRSYMDVMKRIVLQAFLWITLAIVFLAGSNRINVFSLGYLMGAFIFLWQGNDLYLRPIRRILKWWHYLISYNVMVIFVKAVLQMFGCIYLRELKTYACWAVQLFGIACIERFGGLIAKQFDVQECSVYSGDVGLAWDSFCFAFLILQRRLFNSYYFFHIVDEAKAMTILASRGAELIEELSQKRIEEQQETERKILEKIKNKMDRIKASQKKLQGPNFKDPKHHQAEENGDEEEDEGPGAPLAEDASDSLSSPQGFHTPVDSGSPPRTLQPPTPTSAILSRSLDGYLEPQRMSFGSPTDLHRQPSLEDSFPVFSPPPYGAVVRTRPPWLSLSTPRHSLISTASPKSHHTSIRSGDYYMFDEYEEELVDLESSDSGESITSDQSDEIVDQKRQKVSELLRNLLKEPDLVATTDKAEKQNMLALSEYKRRSSVPSRKPLKPSLKRRSVLSLPDSPEKYADTIVTFDQPSTSKGFLPPSRSSDEADGRGKILKLIKEGEEEEEEDVTPPEDKSERTTVNVLMKIISVIKFTIAFINSIMVTLTVHLNKFSRDYRYVMKTLSIEKKQLKMNTKFSSGIRRGSKQIWEPLPTAFPAKLKSSQIEDDGGNSEIYQYPEKSTVQTLESPMSIRDFDDSNELDTKSQPPFIRLLMAVWYAVFSHSELVCYFIIFLHQIRSPTILSLPLPLMVFLWGTLTVPRPSKTFWITIIAYTEACVIIKCIFQFELIPWNSKLIPDNTPFALPRILGIERQPGMYAYYDLLLLLVVFFHRSMLKSLGLWKTSTYSTGTKTSPVTDSSEVELSLKTDEAGAGTGMEGRRDSEVVLLAAAIQGDTVSKVTSSGDADTNQIFPMKLKSKKYMWPFVKFFEVLMRRSGKVTDDVYAYMFFCDFFNFLVVIFGFAAFGSSQGEDGGVSQYFEENKVPIPFLVMLILQFGLIIVDRTLYLRKFILGKLIFQFILVIGIHIWMFFVLPAVTQRNFNAALPPQMWYMVKCFYLLLSAYQIRVGYPTRILGNFLCKSYNYINMFLFKVFMAVPFVFELRALMDWIWTDTSMTLSDWLKMEDIFAHVFQLKCQRRAEDEYPQPRGEKKNNMSKYLMGGGALFGIIAVIWFPLVLFALGNTVGEPNLPFEVSVSVQIGSFQPIYKYTVRNDSIFSITEKGWEQFSDAYQKSRVAQNFLSNYLYDDIGVAVLDEQSTTMWTMSPPAISKLISQLQSNDPVPYKMVWSIARKTTNPEEPPRTEAYVENWIQSGDPNRELLTEVLNGTKTGNNTILLKQVMPKFIKVTSRGTADPIDQLMTYDDEKRSNEKYRNLLVSGNHDGDSWWWDIKEDCKDSLYDNLLKYLPINKCSNKIVLYTFNDKAFPATLNIISGKGIIGLYTTFVIVIHSVIRGFFTGISFKIMFDDMPNVDRLLQLCLDIYLVRESGDLDLEEDLFAKLVFLYRSPETLIKWTRPPEEIAEDEQDAQQELND